MPKSSFLRRPSFSTQNLLADALASSIFLIICISASSLFLVTSANQLYIYFLCCLLTIPAAVFLILRRLALSILPMLLLHLFAALALPLFLASLGTAVTLSVSIASLALMTYSLLQVFRLNNAVASPPLLILSFYIHLFCLFLTSMRGENSLTPFLTSGFLISVCLYLAIRQIFKFQKGFDHFLHSPTQPGKSIQVNNNRIVVLLCIVTAIIFPLSIVFPYNFIVEIFKSIVRFLFTILAFLMNTPPVYSEEPQSPDPAYSGSPIPDNSSLPIGILSVILDCLAVSLFLFIAVYGIYRVLPSVLSFLRKYFRIHPRTQNLLSSQYITDETIDLDQSAHHKNKKLPAFGTGEERKVRKQYYKLVRESIQKGASITGASSAGDIQNTILDQFGKDITELTVRYEEVRYGPGNQSHNGRLSRKR